jgi:hypothetical protein
MTGFISENRCGAFGRGGRNQSPTAEPGFVRFLCLACRFKKSLACQVPRCWLLPVGGLSFVLEQVSVWPLLWELHACGSVQPLGLWVACWAVPVA